MDLLFVYSRNRRYYNHKTTNAAISSIPVSSIIKSRRDILIDQLQNKEVHCDLICTDRIENKDPIWSCSDCYQILHLKCVMIWYIKSHISKYHSNSNKSSPLMQKC